jgi:hypothetical protein
VLIRLKQWKRRLIVRKGKQSRSLGLIKVAHYEVNDSTIRSMEFISGSSSKEKEKKTVRIIYILKKSVYFQNRCFLLNLCCGCSRMGAIGAVFATIIFGTVIAALIKTTTTTVTASIQSFLRLYRIFIFYLFLVNGSTITTTSTSITSTATTHPCKYDYFYFLFI